MNDYLNSLFQIVRFGLNTNSYKFAFWRSLVRISTDPGRTSNIVSVRELAPLFLELYWPLEVQYHIRQSTDPDKDPVVMTAIRKLMREGVIPHGMKLEKFKRQNPIDYQTLLTTTEKYAFNYVISCFHEVRRADVKPAFFQHQASSGKSGKEITLVPDAIAFFSSHANLVDYLAVAGWVAFTEKISSAPNLFSKLSGVTSARSSLSSWRPILNQLQDGQCFYCSSTELSNAHIDHFIPWSYVLEDKTWNLVLACSTCNLGKSDQLPRVNFVDQLVQRNLDLLEATIQVTEQKFLRHFDEWRERDLAAHIRALHSQANSEQYPIWGKA